MFPILFLFCDSQHVFVCVRLSSIFSYFIVGVVSIAHTRIAHVSHTGRSVFTS